MPRLAVIATSLAVALLAACDMLAMESPGKLAAAREAEGKAVGGACRHAGRAIEDCYTLNKRVDKAAIFAGWRDMNDYMRENKLEPIAPLIPTQVASAKAAAEAKVAEAKSTETKAAADTEEASVEKRPPAKGKAAKSQGT